MIERKFKEVFNRSNSASCKKIIAAEKDDWETRGDRRAPAMSQNVTGVTVTSREMLRMSWPCQIIWQECPPRHVTWDVRSVRVMSHVVTEMSGPCHMWGLLGPCHSVTEVLGSCYMRCDRSTRAMLQKVTGILGPCNKRCEDL